MGRRAESGRRLYRHTQTGIGKWLELENNVMGTPRRDNDISHCEQAGIVGSLGGAFSFITGNTIHQIHVRQSVQLARRWRASRCTAALMCKLPGTIFTAVAWVFWLDWMDKARAFQKPFHDNYWQDLFF